MLSFKHTREDEEFHSCEVVKRTNIVHVNSVICLKCESHFSWTPWKSLKWACRVSLRGNFKTRQRPKTQVYDKLILLYLSAPFVDLPSARVPC